MKAAALLPRIIFVRGTNSVVLTIAYWRFTMGKDIHTPAVNQLFSAILTLKTVEECYQFFEDVCTIQELVAISQRFEVADMLTQKKTYLDIAEKTGASTATISRVNRSLTYGNDGYALVLKRMAEAAADNSGEEDK